ncbi:MAG: GNAT family N-acetyltransferase [Ilumatobacteraceae bacterium]
MEGSLELSVVALHVEDVDAYLDLNAAVDAGSGVDGAAHSHPYSRFEPFDRVEAHDREVTRWSTPVGDLGWRRAWGLRTGGALIGYVYLAGGTLRAESHRAGLGMGVLGSHRRRGGGSMLLDAAIAWARDETGLAWIDLGVFTDNRGAHALYATRGFREVGRTPDRFRVDGARLDDIAMTLDVSGASEP